MDFNKKFSYEFSLFLHMMNRALHLAATTTAAATAFTFVAIAVIIEHCQIVHGFHLLSVSN